MSIQARIRGRTAPLASSEWLPGEADSFPFLKSHCMATSKQDVSLGQKELQGMGTDLQRATSRPTLQFSYNLHKQPKDRCPFKFWNLVELDPSNYAGGSSHTSIWEWQPLSLPVVFRADVSEGAFLVLLSIHYPTDLSVSVAGGRMYAIRPTNPVHWPSIQAFSEHWKVATLQGQGQRGRGGWVNGLWSFNQERRHDVWASGGGRRPAIGPWTLHIFSFW